jgi:acetolactate synthase-1/2/3 large subunit
MGCGLPAAIGAALANPQATCLAICGDGGFAMTSQELMMAKVYELNVKVRFNIVKSRFYGLT